MVLFIIKEYVIDMKQITVPVHSTRKKKRLFCMPQAVWVVAFIQKDRSEVRSQLLAAPLGRSPLPHSSLRCSCVALRRGSRLLDCGGFARRCSWPSAYLPPSSRGGELLELAYTPGVTPTTAARGYCAEGLSGSYEIARVANWSPG